MSTVNYIAMSQIGLSLTMALVMLLLVHKFPRYQYLRAWVFGFALVGMSWLIKLYMLNVSNSSLLETTYAFFKLLSVVTLPYGFLVRRTQRMSQYPLFILAFLAFLVVFYFEFMQTQIHWRVMISSLFCFICITSASLLFWEPRTKSSKSDTLVLFFLSLIALTVLALSIESLVSDTAHSELVTRMLYFVVPGSFGVIAVMLMLVVVNDITQQMHQQAMTDTLTGALNQIGLDEISDKLMAYCERSRQWISVIVTEIDHIDYVSEQIGLAGNDLVMQRFASTIKANLRKGDYIGRTSGSEFILLLPDTNQDGALLMVERIRLAIGQATLSHRSQTIRLTASFGVVSSCTDYFYKKLLSRAEHSLYQAKMSGRNCIVQSQD